MPEITRGEAKPHTAGAGRGKRRGYKGAWRTARSGQGPVLRAGFIKPQQNWVCHEFRVKILLSLSLRFAGWSWPGLPCPYGPARIALGPFDVGEVVLLCLGGPSSHFSTCPNNLRMGRTAMDSLETARLQQTFRFSSFSQEQWGGKPSSRSPALSPHSQEVV